MQIFPKAFDVLGWDSNYTIEDIVKDEIAYYKKTEK